MTTTVPCGTQAVRSRAMVRRQRRRNLLAMGWTLIALAIGPRAADAACKVTAQGTVDCDANTRTMQITNYDGSTTISSARTQHFRDGSPIHAIVRLGVSLNTNGLDLAQGRRFGLSPEAITIVNQGLIRSAQPENTLQLDGNGGLIAYSGNGIVLNTNASTGDAIFADNKIGNIAISTGSGIISGPVGIEATTTQGGTITISTGSALVAGTAGDGIEARSASGAVNVTVGSGGVASNNLGYSAIDLESGNGDLTVTANGAVTAGGSSKIVAPPAIMATSHGSGNILIDGSGTVTAPGGRGIWAEQDETGLGGIVVSGTGATFGEGVICPGNANLSKGASMGLVGCSGIRASIKNAADGSPIVVSRSGDVSGTSAAINARTAGNGAITVDTGANATLTGVYGFGIEVNSKGQGSQTISTAGSASNINTGGTGIIVLNQDSKISAGAGSMIAVTTTGTITSTGNLIAQANIRQNPVGVLAAISAGYVGGSAITPNPNVNGAVRINNGAILNVAVGDGIVAYNFGNGAVSINNGAAITAPTGVALYGGATMQGTIANSSDITASVAAIDTSKAGAATVINQQAGTIAGNVLLSGHGDTINITGGAISGQILGNSAVNGALAGTVNFDATNFTTGGGIDVASINVIGGALTLANDVTVFDALTNASLLGLVGNSTRTITGSYIQTATGTLSVAVSPTGAAQLNVTRTATLAGTLALQYAPGTYGARTYPILTAAGGIGGSFAAVTEAGSVPSTLARSVTYGANTVDLVLAEAPATVAAAADAALFSAQDSLLALLAQQSLSTLLGTYGSSVTCSGPATAAEVQPATDAAPSVPFCRAGGWLQLAYLPMQADASGGVPGFSANAVHLLTGADWPLADGRIRVGIAAGYDQGWLNDSAGGQAGVQVGRIGAYGSASVGPAIITATLGYGHDWDTTQRATAVGTVTESHGGNEVAGGVQARLPLALGDYTLTPMAGARFAAFGENGFTETGSGAAAAFATSGAASSFNSIVPYARLKLSRAYVTSEALRIAPEVQVGYDYQAGTGNPTVLLTAGDGTGLTASGLKLDRSSAVVDAGIGVGRGNWTAFADVHANLAGNWSSETVQAGLRLAF